MPSSHPLFFIHCSRSSMLNSSAGLSNIMPKHGWPIHTSLGFPLPLPMSFADILKQSHREVIRDVLHGVLLGWPDLAFKIVALVP